MPAEWPKLAPDWLFAQLLKCNRSACPRVCVISISFAYVNRPRLSLRSCTDGGSPFVSRGCLMSKWESRSPQAPPTQTRCLGRSNTGRSLALPSPHSHAARPAHQLLSARRSCWIYRWTTGEFKPAAPSWEGTYRRRRFTSECSILVNKYQWGLLVCDWFFVLL